MTDRNQNGFLRGLRSLGRTTLNLFSPKRRRRQQEEMERDFAKEEAIRSPWRNVVRKFFKNPFGVIGLIGFILIFGFVFIGARVVPFDVHYTQGSLRNVGPSKGYMNVPKELLDEGVRSISSGTTFSVGVSETGKFYQWGHNSEKTLEMPEKIKKELANKKVSQAAAGDRHIIVVTEDNEVYSWGNNAFKQTEIPSKVKRLIKEEGLKKIEGGDQFSVLLTNKGSIMVWGSTLPNNLSTIPKKLQHEIEDFKVGGVNILLKLKGDKLTLIGAKGTELETSMPQELKDGKVKIRSFARIQRSGAVVTDEGKLIVWGSLSENYNLIPEIKEKVVEVIAGRDHFVARGESGKLYAWGSDTYNVTKVPTDEGYQKMYSGYYNNYALKDAHHVSTWGLDGFRFGTDEMGRDLFTRLIHGGEATLQISFIAVIIQIVIGVIVGMVAGYFGGWVDNILMRFSEIVASFPFYPTIITLSATIPPDASAYQRILLVMILLGILSWTSIARLIRGQILAEREKDYITAARALGLRESKIMMSHILPNVISIIIVQATLGYAGNLLSEAGLSFLGFGVVEPYPSWGNMMTAAQATEVIEVYWWRWIIPGLAVFLTALTVNLMGDALRDALDPKAQER